MRVITLLITILIIGFLVKQKLGSDSSSTDEKVSSPNNTTIPQVPTTPQDIGKFKNDLNKFIHEKNEQRIKDISEL